MIQQFSKPNFILGGLNCFRGTLIQNLLVLIRCVLKTKGKSSYPFLSPPKAARTKFGVTTTTYLTGLTV